MSEIPGGEPTVLDELTFRNDFPYLASQMRHRPTGRTGSVQVADDDEVLGDERNADADRPRNARRNCG